MKQWIVDVQMIRFTWLVPGDGPHVLEIIDPIEVVYEKDFDSFRTMKGMEITVDHTWNYCHTVKRNIH